MSDVNSKIVREAMNQLRKDVAELEQRFEYPLVGENVESVKSLAVRVFNSARSVKDLLSALDSKSAARPQQFRRYSRPK